MLSLLYLVVRAIVRLLVSAGQPGRADGSKDLEILVLRQPPEAVPPPDRFGGPRLEHGDDGVLRGTGASAGVARGPARVVLGPADFDRVQSGDIIVAPSSNPSWVPLFTIVAGLVTNTGGVLCHAAVVAREFALPAVVGVAGATTSIAGGRPLEIDAIQGIEGRL